MSKFKLHIHYFLQIHIIRTSIELTTISQHFGTAALFYIFFFMRLHICISGQRQLPWSCILTKCPGIKNSLVSSKHYTYWSALGFHVVNLLEKRKFRSSVGHCPFCELTLSSPPTCACDCHVTGHVVVMWPNVRTSNRLVPEWQPVRKDR